jgi:hypothetical protein
VHNPQRSTVYRSNLPRPAPQPVSVSSGLNTEIFINVNTAGTMLQRVKYYGCGDKLWQPKAHEEDF